MSIMASMQPYPLLQTDLPPHCTPTSAFLVRISTYFGTCIPTPLALISTLLGCCSILSWLFAQMPQIYKNFQLKSSAGLSVFFLGEWLLGDLTNLLGAVFTNQADWQIVVATYYVFVDVCLVSQYFWYSYIVPRWWDGSLHSGGSSVHSDDDDDADSDMINSLSPINSSFAESGTDYFKIADEDTSKNHASQPVDTPRFSNVNYEKGGTSIPPSWGKGDSVSASLPGLGLSPRTVLYAATLSSLAKQATASPLLVHSSTAHNILHIAKVRSAVEIAGTILSWSSTGLYLGSRLPQLYQNWKRQSTAGLSPLLFLAAFCGNLFYSSSLLTNPNAWNDFGPYGGHGWADEDGSERWLWIANAAPFFLGAFGVLFMDGTMGAQFLMYGEGREKMVKVRNRKGYGRWRRVRGWMRGWIPSLQKEKVVNMAESQRLLSESRDWDRHGNHTQYGGI